MQSQLASMVDDTLSQASGSDEDGGLGLLDYEEVDMGQLTKVVKVKRCLKQCEQFWRDTFHALSFMTTTVSNGYIPPFYVVPPPLFSQIDSLHLHMLNL